MSATANRTTIRFKEETTAGTAITGTADGLLRLTGETLGFNQDYISSSEIRSDRGRARGVRSASRISGDLSFEWSYGSLDKLLPGLCGQDDWETGGGSAGASITAVAADGVTGSFTTGNWVKDQIVEIKGANNAGNNGFYRITSVADAKLGLAPALTADSTVTNTKVHGEAMGGNGTTETSYTIEKFFDDATSDKSHRLAGCRIGGLDLSVATSAIVTGSLSVLGESQTIAATAGLTDGTATTTRVFNTADDHNHILVDDSDLDGANSFSVSISNNLREVLEIGSRSATDIALGSCSATGSLEVYYDDKTVYEKMLNGTQSRVTIILSDGTDWYGLHFPSVDFTSGNVLVEGLDSDVFARLDWEASVRDGNMFTLSRSG